MAIIGSTVDMCLCVCTKTQGSNYKFLLYIQSGFNLSSKLFAHDCTKTFKLTFSRTQRGHSFFQSLWRLKVCSMWWSTTTTQALYRSKVRVVNERFLQSKSTFMHFICIVVPKENNWFPANKQKQINKICISALKPMLIVALSL